MSDTITLTKEGFNLLVSSCDVAKKDHAGPFADDTRADYLKLWLLDHFDIAEENGDEHVEIPVGAEEDENFSDNIVYDLLYLQGFSCGLAHRRNVKVVDYIGLMENLLADAC